MEISTNLNLGTVSADIDVDVDDIGTHMQPWIESAVASEVSEIDWDFLHEMIRDEFHNGTIEDMVSTAVSNGEAPSVDGAGIAEELLTEYLGRDALGSSDDTGCHLASSFEQAVRLANRRNNRSGDGAGIAATNMAAVHQLDVRLAQLEQIVRRLTMADRNHATATDLISSTLIGAPIYPPTTDTDTTVTDNTSAVLG